MAIEYQEQEVQTPAANFADEYALWNTLPKDLCAMAQSDVDP